MVFTRVLVLDFSVQDEILVESKSLEQGQQLAREVLGAASPAGPSSCLHPRPQAVAQGCPWRLGGLCIHALEILMVVLILQTRKRKAPTGLAGERERGLRSQSNQPQNWKKNSVSRLPGNWRFCLSPVNPLPSVSGRYLQLGGSRLNPVSILLCPSRTVVQHTHITFIILV